MRRKTMTAIGAGVAAAGLTFGLISTALADNSTTQSGQPASASAQAVADDTGPGGPREEPLTGSDAEKATAAAQAAVPDGTVMRVEADADGGAVYEAHVRKADGTHVVVLMDESFAVTSVQELAGRGPGPGGPREEPLTGSDAEKATAAAQAAVPDGTVMRVEADADGGAVYEAHVRKADGTHVVVLMDESFAVTSVQELAGRGPGHGPHGPGGPNGNGGSGAAGSAGAAGAAA